MFCNIPGITGLQIFKVPEYRCPDFLHEFDVLSNDWVTGILFRIIPRWINMALLANLLDIILMTNTMFFPIFPEFPGVWFPS